MQYVSKPHYYIGNRRQENNGLGRIGVSGQISREGHGAVRALERKAGRAAIATRPGDGHLSPDPPNGVVAVAEQGIWRSDCPGRFWTVGVSGRSAVVVSSRSPRDRTQQETHTGGSGRGVGGRLHWVSQGQGGGGCRVRRRGERVSCPASAKTRRRRVLVVTSCSP